MTILNPNGDIVGERGLGSTAYEHDFYSGSQIFVMVGDVLIDAAIGISFEKQQSRRPIYSYANPYYSFLGAGQIIVTGNLIVAFKEGGYLLYALKRFQDLKNSSEWASPRYVIDESGNLKRNVDNIDTNTKFKTVAEEARRKRTMRANVEQSMEWDSIRNNVKSSKEEKIGAAENYSKLVKQLGRLDDDKFEDWAETFEDAIWYGTDIQNSYMRDKVNSFNFQDGEAIDDEAVLSHRTPDLYPPIDIWVVYGDTNNHATNHTVRKILDVSFTGLSTQINVSPDVIYESYPFVARNLV